MGFWPPVVEHVFELADGSFADDGQVFVDQGLFFQSYASVVVDGLF